MGGLIEVETELVVDARVYVRVEGRWSTGVVTDFRGESVQVRFTAWNREEAETSWFEQGEVRVISPFVERERWARIASCPHDHEYRERCTGCEACAQRVTTPVIGVTVYQVTRHYGGPQEGGWWWNRSEAVCTIPLIRPGDPDEIEEVKAFLAPRFPDEGNISSVRGGVEHHINATITPDEFEVLTSGGYQ